MNHADHVQLIRKGVTEPGGVWAELGAGSGAFTLALADLLGSTGQIYAVDKDRGALNQLKQTMSAQFPAQHLETIEADFSRSLTFPPLNGLLMANSLHFVRKKDPLLQQIRQYLLPGGKLLLVEYNADRGNPWVLYPFSYPTWEVLARQNGFSNIQLLERRPSRFLGEIYAALAFN